MSKKEKTPSTPESRAKKLADKQEVRKAFTKTFFPAIAICLSVLLIYSLCYMAFIDRGSAQIEAGTEQTTSVSSSGGSTGGSDSNSDSDSDSNSSSDVNSNSDSNSSSGSSDTADGSETSLLDEFNTAMNKIKSEATITHVSGGTSNNGGLDDSSTLPSLVKSAAGGIIDSALSSNGVADDGSVIDASAFPVENTDYSSKLTEDDISSISKSGNTITVVLKDDELGEADNGHGSKAMNVIKSSIIMDNIPSIASSIVSDAKTSCKNGTIVVELDDSGRVVKADYTFDWDIEVSGSSIDAIIHLKSEEHYTMAY